MMTLRMIGRVLTLATLLSLGIAWPNSSSWAAPERCSSTQYDLLITQAVDRHWSHFKQPIWWKAQLCQESHLRADAVSPVGAQGLAQIMPATYADIVRQLKWTDRKTAFNPDRAIEAGAWYQARSDMFWGAAGRTPTDRHRLGLCNYNAGGGNCLKAQTICAGARMWEGIQPCMGAVTGIHARETSTYISNITLYSTQLRIGPP